MGRISIAIVDDHPIYRKGLKDFIEEETKCRVVLSVSNGKELMEQMEWKTPDILLLDIRMPGMDGIDTAEKVKKEYPDVKIIAISSYDSEAYIVSFLKAGGSAYLVKGDDTESICDVIQDVIENGYHLNKRVSLASVAQLSKASHLKMRTQKTNLSEREVEVLRLITQEKTTPEIAKTLNLSQSTVKTYREFLFQKTGAKNIAGLVMYAVRKGIIEP